VPENAPTKKGGIVRLTVFERLMLQSILPQEGDFVTLKLVRKLRETLAFDEREIKEIDFKTNWRCPKCQKVELSAEVIKCLDCGVYMQSAGAVTWDEEKALKIVKDIHLGDKMLALCSSILKKLSDEKKMSEQHMSLYEKIVSAEEQDG